MGCLDRREYISGEVYTGRPAPSTLGMSVDSIPSKTDDPNLVTVGTRGKVARFVPRGGVDTVNGQRGYVRLSVGGNRYTITGFVRNYGTGGKTFVADITKANAFLAF